MGLRDGAKASLEWSSGAAKERPAENCARRVPGNPAQHDFGGALLLLRLTAPRACGTPASRPPTTAAVSLDSPSHPRKQAPSLGIGRRRR